VFNSIEIISVSKDDLFTLKHLAFDHLREERTGSGFQKQQSGPVNLFG
jgi:hypothetical protein